ncbi:MAG: glycosyltransferase family 9 protein [Desulfovibrionaceae bacterium]|nr:glycosyltransferase family 9 protein [Desulfovibrionaceae bacterium]
MKKYLVVQLARFGDLVQTKRLMATLCGRPDSEVHLCLDRGLVPLAEILYPKAALHPLVAHAAGPGGDADRSAFTDNRSAFAELKRLEPDAVFNLNFSPLNFRLAALFDPGLVRGYKWKNGQEIKDAWPSLAMRWSGARRLGINLMDFWAAYARDMIAPDMVNPEAAPRGGGLGVVLAGKRARRSLPPEVLARIVTVLRDRTSTGRITLLGDASMRPAARAVLKDLPKAAQEAAVDLSGRTDWAGLVEAVSGLDMLATPDTGTMHLAAHLGVPVRAFFLSSAWCFETGPYGLGHTVYQALDDCLPCLETRDCPHRVRCLECFRDPGLVRFLATGRAEHLPSGAAVFESAFDSLGLTYSLLAGEEPFVEQRQRMRAFIARHLGLGQGPDAALDPALAEGLYLERDWMTKHSVFNE